MNAKQLLSLALESGVVLYLKDGQLNFKAEKGKFTSDLKEQIKRNREEIISYLQQIESSTKKLALPKLSSFQKKEFAPLSYAQQRLWFLSELEEQSNQFNLPGKILIDGEFSSDAFKYTINQIVERHEILRTNYVSISGQALQTVCDNFSVSIPEHDFSSLSAPERESRIMEMAKMESKIPFDLRKDLMIRVQLIKIDREQHLILYTLHHIASDGWSMSVFKKEFNEIYNSYITGKSSNLEPLRIQYSDYAQWQRSWIDSDLVSEQLAYWKEQLANLPTLHSLPLDFVRPEKQTFKVKTYRHLIDHKLTTKLNQMTRTYEVSLFMILQSAFAILLSQYGDSNDIVMGTPVAGRSQSELEPMIGLFLNSLVLRTQIDSSASFEEILKNSKATILDAFSNQDVTFEKLVELLAPERHLAYSPIYQIWFVLQNNEKVEFDIGDSKVSSSKGANNASGGEEQTAKYELNLFITESEKGLHCTWKYNELLFASESIEYVAKEFSKLVDEICFKPQVAVEKLNFFNYDELTKIAVAQQHTELNWFKPRSLIEQFSRNVKLYPQNPAVFSNERYWSYEALDRISNSFAKKIQEQCNGERVALLFDHNISMAFAILGALKAGKTYVPLDAQYPIERLQYIIQDADACAIVSQEAFDPIISELVNNEDSLIAVSTDDCWLERNRCLDHNELDNSNAYILYTSGSTGKPKGVLQSQQNVLYFIQRYCESLDITPDDKILQVASFNFDASVMDFYASIFSGACLYLLDVKTSSPNEVVNFVKSNQISIYHSTPTILKYLDESDINEPLASVKAVVLGGEAIDPSIISVYLRRFSAESKFVNGFGPTESTLALQMHTKYQDVKLNQVPKLGYSVKGTNVRVLDENGNNSPVFSRGEIVIESPHVALRYWNLKELTNKKFKSDSKGNRQYFTGDQGRFLANGSIEFLGREDSQVKIRGIRIELGEIESQLIKLNQVKSAVVTLQKDQYEQTRLIAYVVLKESQEHKSNWKFELAAELKASLPSFMLPEFYLELKQIPLTPSGKVDRNALPSIDEMDFEGAEYQEPRNETERKLCDIWLKLLKVDKVGVLDNFFSLGGHSLLATRVISEIRDVFKIEIPLRKLFESPTIAELADDLRQSEGDLNLPSIIKADREQILPLSFAQQRLWFIDQLDSENYHYNMSGRFTVGKQLNIDAFKSAVRDLIRRHEVLRTCYHEKNGTAHQVILSEYETPVLHVDLSGYSESEQLEQVKSHVAEESKTSFDLSKDLMVRVRVLSLRDDYHVVVHTIHHIACDAWSVGILRNELSELYSAYENGLVSDLLPLSVQYADYALWQKSWLQEGILDKQLSYWESKLSGLPVIHSIPLDKPRPKHQTFEGQRIQQVIDEERTAKINALCQKLNVTLFMFLHSVFTVLLRKYSKENDIVIGLPVAGRIHKDVEPLIGCFVNNLVLRSNFDEIANPCHSFVDVLNYNKAMILEADANQHIPFEMLVDKVSPERSLNHNPLTQISFVLQNIEQGTFETKKNSVASAKSSKTHIYVGEEFNSKFDLELAVIENNSQLQLGWGFNLSLFEEQTINRMAANFTVLLDEVMEDISTGINKDINLLNTIDDKEKQALLYKFNNTFSPYPKEQCVHELFELQVESQADSIAAIFKDKAITYGELNRRANQLAHYLVANGIGPEKRVGLCIERSFEMIIGILGILKAGGCYVPLDPEYPESRLEYMVTQSGCELILSERHLLEDLPFLSMRKTIPLDRELHSLLFGKYSTDNIPVNQLGTRSTNLAYIIYTSGSTGEPKGVTIDHGNITSLVSTQNLVSIEQNDIVGQLSNHSFDAITYELWGSLLNGSRLLIVEKDTFLEPALFHEQVVRHKMSILFITTALFNRISQESPKTFGYLKKLCFGGEAFSPQAIEMALASPPESFLHVYGPTECTTFATAHELQASHFMETLSAPIGQPLSNNTSFVINDYELAPIGVVGELCIGGEGLSRGYLGYPELTASRFIPNPYSDKPGERLYRTGDLVRLLANGDIEFIGRVDHQVKVRGFRIELSEIETVLLDFTNLREATVLAREDSQGHKRLVAYIVMDESSDYDSHHLQLMLLEHLKSHLPDYMIPNAFVFVKSIPLTPNKKVDRKALPEPDETAFLRTQYVAANTSIEETLVGLWEENLQVEKVGVEDNYFSIGGDSIRSISLVAEAKQKGVHFSVKDLFSNPTIKSLAKVVTIGSQVSEPEEVPPFSLVSEEELEYLKKSYVDDELEDIYPMSMAQQGMIFHSLQRKEMSVYHDVIAYRIELDWHSEHFQQALGFLIQKHAILRTRFHLEGTSLMQVVFTHKAAEFEVQDISKLDSEEQEACTKTWIEEEKRQGVNLITFPWKICIQLCSNGEIVFGMSFHHALWDGWSNANFISELLTVYAQVQSIGKIDNSSNPPPYKHFIALEQSALSSEENLAYWRDTFSDARLPWWSGEKQASGQMSLCRLPKESSQALIDLARKLGVQEKSVWLAVYISLLSFLEGAADVVGSVVVHGRPEIPESDKTLGLFLNTLPIRMDVTETSWASLIKDAEGRMQTLYGMRHFPLLSIQTETGLDFSASMFNYTNFRVYGEKGSDKKIANKGGFEENNYRFSFQVSKDESSQQFRAYISVDPTVFPSSFRERISHYVGEVVSQMLANEDAVIEKNRLLSNAEITQLISTAKDAHLSLPQDLCLASLFEKQVEISPEAVAIVCSGYQISYSELNRRANELSHRLINFGVSQSSPIGIFIDRSIEMVTAILAVLKAGGCYIPLDPQFPHQRLSYLIEDSGIKCIVSKASVKKAFEAALSENEYIKWVMVERDEEVRDSSNSNNPSREIKPNSLAYTIYTSGSTGKPKGVSVSHKNAVNFLYSMKQKPGISSQDRLLAVTTLSFDIALLELMLPLVNGACVDIVQSKSVMNGDELIDRINNQAISIMQATPITWKLLLESGWQGSNKLKALVGGEALSKELANNLVHKVKEFWNMYGPTETTVWSTIHEITSESLSLPSANMAIGKAIGNTEVYVVDEALNLVPMGVPGQLCIGGEGVSLGYWQRAKLTADRFVPNPWSEKKGERLYLTGDLVKYMANGNLEFIGRTDQQIKIRGFRIELGEIEHRLTNFQGVRNCLVTTYQDAVKNTQLVAYLVLENINIESTEFEENRSQLVNNIIESLRVHLPDYMVPRIYSFIDDIPLTLNGKIDRKRLPLPKELDFVKSRYIEPRNAVESKLCEFWATVLKLDKVGIEDDFFLLGGHSLLATQLVNLIRKEFNQELPLRVLFEKRTVKEFAQELTEQLVDMENIEVDSDEFEEVLL